MLRCLDGAISLSSSGLMCQVDFFSPPNVLEREGALQKGNLRLLLKDCLLLGKAGKHFWFRLAGLGNDRGDLLLRALAFHQHMSSSLVHCPAQF